MINIFHSYKSCNLLSENPLADRRPQMHDRGMQLIYLGFYRWGALVPIDTLRGGRKDFKHVEKERPVLVTNDNSGPPACLDLQGSFLPSPSLCQVITTHGGNTGHRPSHGQVFWGAASNLTRRSRGAGPQEQRH